MLFDRYNEPKCANCRNGTSLGQDRIACLKRGIMAGFGSCGAFRYEPTKRIPEVPPKLSNSGLSKEDFSLW